MPLLEKNDFLPDLENIPVPILKKAKLMFINYPNNPTSAGAGTEFFRKVIRLARQHNIIVCHDASYTEIFYNRKPLSFMQIPGAGDVGIEFHSLSKTYNMTGWRIGYAVGNKDILAGLGKIKTNLDSGIFQAIQEAAITALDTDDRVLSDIRKIYRERRDTLCNGLKNLGLQFRQPDAAGDVVTELPPFLAAEALRDGRLVALLPDHPFPEQEVSLLYQRQLHPSRVVRAYLDYCQRVVGRYLARA